MKIYKVYLDMSIVVSRLKKYRIYEYNSEYPIIFVEADDPDGACYTAIYKLLKLVLDQDDSKEARKLCREIKQDIRVISAKSK
jgi:hypothetical protein